MFFCWIKQRFNQFKNWFVIQQEQQEDLCFKQTRAELFKNKEILTKQKKNIKNRKRRKLKKTIELK